VEGIGLALHLSVELAHRELAQLEGTELCIELVSLGLGVAEELAHKRQPSLVRGAAVSPDDVLQI
jgi:hypothetical protein